MVTKSLLAKNAACNAVVDMVDTGLYLPYGQLRIYNADGTSLVSHRCSNPAFMSASDGTATANTIYDAVVTADGTAASFWFIDRDSSNVWGGAVTVAGGGGELELNSISLPLDSTNSITAAKYIVP
jgi:hypothetical protein